MSYNIDYFSVKIPDNKEPKEYSFVERRADILNMILEAGHPRAISQSELAVKYGVSQVTIHNDFEALATFYENTSDRKTVNFITESVYQKSIAALMKQGEFFKASRILEMWNNWLFNMGKIKKSPDELAQKIEVSWLDDDDDSADDDDDDGK